MARAVGFKIDFGNLNEMIQGLDIGSKVINEIMRDILRGPVGNDIKKEVYNRTSDFQKSRYTLSRINVWDEGRRGVGIGIRSNDKTKHPFSKRANAYSIGVWLESGTKPHYIPTKVSLYRRLKFNNRYATRVIHPGTRRANIMRNSIKAYQSDVADVVVRELNRRLAHKMNLR